MSGLSVLFCFVLFFGGKYSVVKRQSNGFRETFQLSQTVLKLIRLFSRYFSEVL